MRNLVRINVDKFRFVFAFITHHPIHSNQIPSEQVQATHHKPNVVDKSKLNFLFLNPTPLILVQTHDDSRKNDLILIMTSEKQNKTLELSKHWSSDSTPARNEVIMKTTYPVNQ